MISNIQQQNFDGVVMSNMLNHETSGLCINNNNTNKNKNINITPQSVMHNENPNGFNYIAPFTIHSSDNAKEYVTPASHTHQEEGFASLLDEISDLIENHPTETESAFKQSNIDRSHSMGMGTQIVLKEQKSMTPNESHRIAFRFIENVHNYSKLNRSDDSTNSSSQDDDEEDDFEDDDCAVDDEDAGDDRNNQEEYHSPDGIIKGDNDAKEKLQEKETPQLIRVPEDDVEEKITPEHHARRPMNAFLIFCKRHRAIVREKYKHLENRSITKILGEWWASLNAEEKTSYTNLAKQYKDAFFSANPNFKWYKLPAPPLRTLSTRPSNIDRPLLASSHHNYSANLTTSTNNYETITSSNNKERYNRTAIHQHYRNESDEEETQDASEVGVFKFADEAQMGGLSSLMKNYNTNNHKNYTITCLSSNLNVLQNVVTVETSSYLPVCKEEPFGNMKEHAAKIGNNNLVINGKRKSTDDGNLNGVKRQLLFSDNNISSGEEDIFGKKSERSCKGKKYQELINSGQIITFTKKTKSKGGDMYSHTSFTHNGYLPHNDSNSYCTTPAAGKIKTEDYNLPPEHSKQIIPVNVDSPVKQFDASDFDLEEKIKALPAQGLEEYLTRKRETKKKKKINSKRHKPRRNSTKESPKTIQEAKEHIQSQMVGSQKRKARKESITRRDINSAVLVNDGQSHIYETVELWSTTAKPESEEHIDKKTNNSTTSDLLILAEVAANHIEDNV